MEKKKIRNIRLCIQITFLIIVTIAAGNHYLTSMGVNISWVSESLFHYICPICGVTSIYQFLFSSSLFVVKLKSSLGIIIGIALILSLIFGPIICGFICPFGAIQDILSRVGRKIFKGKYNTFIKKDLDKKLKYIRYVSLVLAVILTATSNVKVLEAVNPYHAYLSIFNGRYNAVGFVVLFIIIALSLVIQRPWCRYVCPYGAFLGLFNKIKIFRIVRKKDTCISCTKCSRACPMNIEVHKNEEVRDIRCISCFECVDEKVCPKDNTIMATFDDLEDNNEGITLIK